MRVIVSSVNKKEKKNCTRVYCSQLQRVNFYYNTMDKKNAVMNEHLHRDKEANMIYTQNLSGYTHCDQS